MVIKNISLKNFRIHKSTEISFSNSINYIVGGNGQGKTSVIEAIYYLCTTKSCSASSDKEALNFNESFFEIKGIFEDKSKDSIRIYYSGDESKKHYFIEDKQINSASGIIGRFPVVLLTPDDHSLTQSSPSNRRKFIDSILSQASETYLKILIDYNKILRNRSALLSQIKETRNYKLFEQLDAWSEQLAVNGTELIIRRINFIKIFNDYIKKSYKYIMENAEFPKIEYDFLDNPDAENIKEYFLNYLKNIRNDEVRRGANLAGPHRDDLIFKLNDFDLRKFGSQGQHKTFQIGLRFAQFFYLKDITGKTPIFLMDDVFGELDAYRAKKISEYINEIGQTFITMTDLSNMSFLNISESDKIIKIFNGQAANA